MAHHQRRSRLAVAVFVALLTAGSLSAWGQDTPALAFSTSPQNQLVTLTIRESKLRYAFAIESLRDEVKSVQVTVTPFTDATGSRIQPTVTVAGDTTGAAKTVGALQSLPVIIEAELPQPGNYTSSVFLIYGGKKWTPPLTLKVSRAVVPDLEVSDLAAGRATLWSGSRPLLEVGIYEKTGQSFSLPAPQLWKFSRKEGAAQFTAPVSLIIKDEHNRPVSPSIVVGGDKAARHLRFALDGIDEAGQYEGTLRFMPPGVAPIDKAISVYVREPLCVALFWIFFGVAISYLVREYLVKTRPRLVVLRRIEAAAVRLDEILKDSTLDSTERSLALALRHQLSEMSTHLSLEAISVADLDGTLDVFETKLPLLQDWIELYEREVKGKNPDQLIVKGLDTVGVTLRNAAADKQAVDAASKVLADIWSTKAKAAPPSQAQSGAVGGKATLEKLNRWIRTSDALVSAVVLVIACLMGIKALWIPDLSWGGWDDRVIAVLWGLGLHQATFTGVEALRATLAK